MLQRRRASRTRTDDLRSSVLFCCLDLSGYLILGRLFVRVEAVKVTDVGEVDIDILLGVLGVLAASLVDNNLADEGSQNFGRELLDVRVLTDYIKESVNVGGGRLEILYFLSQPWDIFLNRSLFLIVSLGQHTELLTRDLAEDMILVKPFEQGVQLTVPFLQFAQLCRFRIQLSA